VQQRLDHGVVNSGIAPDAQDRSDNGLRASRRGKERVAMATKTPSVSLWRYDSERATPVYPSNGCTRQGWVGEIRVPRWRSTDIIEDPDYVRITPVELSDESGASVVEIQTLMLSCEYALSRLRRLVETAVEKRMRKGKA
jgi:hypothetical protein